MKGINTPRYRDSNRDKGDNKNDFTNQANVQKAKYRLWIKFYPEFGPLRSAKLNRRNEWIKVMYGFMSKPDAGYKQLMTKLEEYKGEYKIAILYDNQQRGNAGQGELERYEGDKQSNLKPL